MEMKRKKKKIKMNEKMLRFGSPFIVKNCLLMEEVFGFLVWVIFYGWYMQI